MVFIPRANAGDRPAMVVELKYNQSADSAINQIKERSQKEVFNNILSHQITFDDSENKKISDEVKDLLKYMLKKDREERMEWVNIPYHPFFKGVVFNYKNSKVSNNYQSSKIIQTFVEKYRDYSAFVVDK